MSFFKSIEELDKLDEKIISRMLKKLVPLGEKYTF